MKKFLKTLKSKPKLTAGIAVALASALGLSSYAGILGDLTPLLIELVSALVQ